ncbi:MAG: hypothetical protein RL885_27890 [Planctomycetota bacterium]
MTKSFLKIGLVGALLLCLAPFASADGRKPGSLLIYPCFDSDGAAGTVVSVTNVDQFVTVVAHFIYIDGEDWREFNRFETLTPRDNFTIRASTHVPGAKKGFLYVVALDESRVAGSLNVLIGDEIVADSGGNFLYAFDAIAFLGFPGINGDSRVQLDGGEYENVSDKMYISSFLGQYDGRGNQPEVLPMKSTLILVALVGSSDYETRLRFAAYNNNEQEFSTAHNFRCWDAVCLEDIDGLFRHDFLITTSYDDRDTGLPVTTGWAEIDGREAVDVVGNEPKIIDPPFVGAIAQTLLSGYFSAGHLLHESQEPNPTDGVLDN